MEQVMQMLMGLQQPQYSLGQQAYQSMMGGGFYGGIIPHGSMGMSPIKSPTQSSTPQMQQKDQMSFGSSPWPGVWGS